MRVIKGNSKGGDNRSCDIAGTIYSDTASQIYDRNG